MNTNIFNWPKWEQETPKKRRTLSEAWSALDERPELLNKVKKLEATNTRLAKQNEQHTQFRHTLLDKIDRKDSHLRLLESERAKLASQIAIQQQTEQSQSLSEKLQAAETQLRTTLFINQALAEANHHLLTKNSRLEREQATLLAMLETKSAQIEQLKRKNWMTRLLF